MDLGTVKCLILVGLFTVCFILGILPVQLIWHFRDTSFTKSIAYERTIGILSCFAAGVFLGTSILDLLPDTREAIAGSIKDIGLLRNYPVAEFIMVSGLIMMLTIEHFALIWQEKQKEYDNKNTGNTANESKHERKENNKLLSNEGTKQTSYYSLVPDSDECTYNEKNSINPISEETSVTSTFKSVLLLIVLSLHSVFEGLAVGLQKDLSDVFEILIGIIVHKGVIAFSLGMTLAGNKLSYCVSLRSVLIFALASPIGIGIGLLITEFGNDSSSKITEGILQGISCGTFLYITLFEILQEELRKPDIRLIKILFLFIGFICMSCIFLVDFQKH